jgi:hypothetical protein
LGLVTLCLVVAACAPSEPYVVGDAPATARAAYSYGYTYGTQTPPTPTQEQPNTVAIVIATPTATGIPVPGDEGMLATLADAGAAIGNDPTGAKAQAFDTLGRFMDKTSAYANAWWFEDDGKADIYEALAVIFYTEGNTSFDVREAVAARYLWYCGGSGTHCQGAALINFLSYFQPWREPWIGRGFTADYASKYEDFARDLVDQHPGLITAMIPGADTYVGSADGLSQGGSVDWNQTLFHFANVHPSWDSYLREKLRRLPNGPARLWVLTMNEASRVCVSQFLCQDMTQARN